jgi:predicted Zn-ribbon and HTH transcriptional regulator
MSQEEAAEEMEISRPTFTRLIESARKKTSDFIINGKFLSLEGGNIHFKNNVIRCEDCGHMFTTKLITDIRKCLNCDSVNISNLAGGFGHGKCCID